MPITKKKIRPALAPQKSRGLSVEFVTAAAIATHYGFQPLPNVVVEREDLSKAKSFYESSLKEVHPFLAKQGSFAGYLEEKMALLRAYTN